MYIFDQSFWISSIWSAVTDAKAERIIQNPGYVEVAPCPCNLMENACDFNCCCDEVNFILMVSIHRSFFLFPVVISRKSNHVTSWDRSHGLPALSRVWQHVKLSDVSLGTEGSQLEQLDGGSSYAESKTLVKAAMARKWKSDHPDSDPSDPIHGMTRSQQTIIFRLRTGHNRLRQHMYKRFKVGDSEICPCGQAPQNTEHVLQTCSSHKQLRARTWPNHTPLEKKLYGTTEELALTVDYIVASGLTVWQTIAGRTKKKKKSWDLSTI